MCLASETPCSFMPTITAPRAGPCSFSSCGAAALSARCAPAWATGATHSQCISTVMENLWKYSVT